MTNIFEIPDTITLINAVELMKTPANYLVNQFFNQKLPTVSTDYIACEYRKGKRLTAPYIIEGTRGVDINRQGGFAKYFKAPMVGPRRTLSISDVKNRMFGEQPIFSTRTPQERAAAMLAQDLTEMLAMIENTKNAMAAKILQGEKVVIEGYADDGELVQESEIDFNFTNITTPATKWDNASAKIISDLRAGIEQIAEATGSLPTMLLCGKNVEEYLIKNNELKDWAKNLRENWSMMSIQPRYLSPQTRYIGTLSALGLEVYSYFETFTDTDGTVKPFIDDDTAILCSPNLGKQASGVINLIDKNAGVQTYASEYVPVYRVDEFAQQISLTVYSRFIMIPSDIESWIVFKVK